MESMLKLQADTSSNIVRAQTNFKKSPKDRITISYVEARLEMLEKLWSSFYTTHRKIIGECDSSKVKDTEYNTKDLYGSTEELYIEHKSELKELLCNLKEKTNVKMDFSQNSNSEHASNLKLPKITLPIFSGKYVEWTSFRDLLVSLIHNNKSLDDVQKLHYLKSHLSDEAEQLLRHVPITSDNYSICWTKLESRYNNKKYLSNCILSRFMGQKAIITESSSALKELLDTSNECLNALSHLGINVKEWDIIVIYILSLKLDSETRKQWEIKISDSIEQLPTWNMFQEFLEQRFRALEFLDPKTLKNSNSRNVTPKYKAFHVSTDPCPYCNESHKLHACKKFANDELQTRRNFVQTQNLCFNCLGSRHSVTSCRSQTRCRICKKRHHSLLHNPNINQNVLENSGNDKPSTSAETVSTGTISQGVSNQAYTSCFSNSLSQVLLATALVNIESRTGASMTFRSMLDQGSQASFITESAVQSLGLKKESNKSYVSVLGSDTSPSVVSRYVVYIKMQSLLDSKFVIRVKAHVLNKLTNLLPSKKVAVQLCSQLPQLSLADPTFDTPNKVDLILGANVYSQVLRAGLVKYPSSGLIAQNTSLGWIISGETKENVDGPISCNNAILNMHVQLDDNDLLRQFWELESEPSSVTTKKHLTQEEQKCEEIYGNTTKRNASGRYIVKLPFKEDSPQCIKGNSKEIALKRLHTLERKLSKHQDLKRKYSEVFNEYLTLGHMEVVPANEIEKSDVCYLPHLSVIREDKSTTQVRIVFDASCPGTNGVSLNNDLMVGPTLQADLRHILIRWRSHPICLTSDIVKMYRQVLVSREDVDFQRVLWREDPNSEVRHYRLLTVTFGTASAPYLAVRTLHQLARDEGTQFPMAANAVLHESYVDDIMTGCQTVSEGQLLYQEMKDLLTKGGFELQKWASNNEELMEWMKSEVEAGNTNDDAGTDGHEPEKENKKLVIKADIITKILGITWDRRHDAFTYAVQLPPLDAPVTKRKVISDISKLYDPLGWLAPVIIRAKVFIQKLWMSGLQWDEELTPNLLAEWIAYRGELGLLSKFMIPRWMGTSSDDVCVELHGFCDASSAAFAAVVYIRVVDNNGEVHVHLVASKTKVAPIKQISIPRLELCGAALLTKLLVEMSEVLKIPKQQVHAWTDSSVVLAWLSSHPSKWKVFVANRVSEILTNLDRQQWSHVQSKENPADSASRGIMPSDLHKNEMWKSGPGWLKYKTVNYGENLACDTDAEERTAKVCQVYANVGEDSISLRFSSLRKLVRVMSWCRRFISLVNKRNTNNFPNWLTGKEIQETLQICIKLCQSQSFSEELECLKKCGVVRKNHKLTSLNPFVDATGLMRVGGRLYRAALSDGNKHPVILPAKSHLTELIIADAHEKTMHGGVQIMINYLRSNYWIIDAKNQVKRFVRNCVVCVRHAARNQEQLMGQLPTARVNPNKPFKHSGVDYAGPISIRASRGRGHHAYKGYICLFVCMATRAIHLEVVSDLTAKGFIAAFKRFVARRGHCAALFSDNGTNFIGAARELKSLLANERSTLIPEIANWLASNGTEWHFIPPHAPNFGGLWEAGIKSTKHHLKRVIGTSTLTFEEMSTVLAQIEACLNSRPMSYVSSDSSDPMPLTPGHFLVGEPMLLVPDANYVSSNISSLRRWQLAQRMVQEFWKKWSQEYLTQFLHRYRWSYQTSEPNIGDVVLVKDDNLPPARWLYGIITDKHTGLDKITRVVSLKCNGNIIKRPVSKLCVLPIAK